MAARHVPAVPWRGVCGDRHEQVGFDCQWSCMLSVDNEVCPVAAAAGPPAVRYLTSDTRTSAEERVQTKLKIGPLADLQPPATAPAAPAAPAAAAGQVACCFPHSTGCNPKRIARRRVHPRCQLRRPRAGVGKPLVGVGVRGGGCELESFEGATVCGAQCAVGRGVGFFDSAVF